MNPNARVTLVRRVHFSLGLTTPTVRGATRSSPPRGFTLLEILLAVALLGLLSAALVTGAAHVIGEKTATPEEVFWQAVRAARKSALKSEKDSRLSFDSKEKRFLVDGGSAQQTFPIPAVRDLSVDLLQSQSAGGSILIGGELVDTHTIPAVLFYPDGTCMPFRAQFRTTGPARVIAIDPWTCSPVLEASKS